MLKDSRSYEVQIIDAVRSVNKALGGTYGTSSAIYKSEFNQYEVQLIDAIKGIGRTLSSKGLSLVGGGVGEVTAEQFQALSQRVTKLEQESFFRLVDGNVTLKEEYRNLWVPGWMAAGGIGSGGGGGGGSSYLKEMLDVYHNGNGILRADGTAVVAGDALVYNSTLGWVAAPVSGGGGSSVVVTQSTASGVQTTTITVDGVPTSIPVTAVAFGTQASDKIPITIGATTKNVLTSHQSLSGYVPTSRQVNGHPLTADVTVTKGDLGLGNVENTKLSTWAGSQNITTLGTISTGVWNGTAIGVTKGGTGLTSIAKGSLLYASSANVLSALAPNGTSTKKFLSQTGSNAPAWGTLSTGDITNIETWITGKGYALASDLTSLSGTVTSISSRVTSIEGWFEVVSVNGQSALHAKNGMAIYSDSWIASGGVGSGSGGGGGTAVAWGTKSGYTRPLIVEGVSETLLLDGSLTGYATQSWVQGRGYLTSETDPTVPAWAKASSKPSYTLDEIADGSTRKLANYLPLAGGTMTGSILTSADSTNSIGASGTRFLAGHIRNIYTTYLAFMSDNGQTQTGVLDFGDGRATIHLLKPDGTEYGNYSFFGAYGFFHNGDGDVPCGRSDHRWEKVWSVDADLSGNMSLGGNIVPATDNTGNIGTNDLRFSTAFIRNIYTTFFQFRDGTTKTPIGQIAFGEGYAQFSLLGNDAKTFMFYSDKFFASGGNADLGLSDHRWSDVYSNEVDIKGGLVFRNSSGNKTGYISAQDGYMFFQAGTNIESSYKQLTFNPTLGLYPESSGLALGYNGANYRWSTIYGVNADLTGDLDLASTSHIDIGPARIEYDATNGAIHVTTNQTGNNAPTIGFYVDGFSAAGGVGTPSGSVGYVNCASQAEYNAIANKSASTIYTVGNPVVKVYLGTILLYSEN